MAKVMRCRLCNGRTRCVFARSRPGELEGKSLYVSAGSVCEECSAYVAHKDGLNLRERILSIRLQFSIRERQKPSQAA